MPNRKQRRDTKKLMQRPELKSYVDKVCMDIANAMVEHCEKASLEAQEQGKELKFEDVEDKVKESMSGIGVQLAQKMQEIAKTYAPKQNFKPNGLRVNIK